MPNWLYFKKNWRKIENNFDLFWQFFDNVWYYWPRDINIHIQKKGFASTRNSGSPCLGFKLPFPIFIFRTFGQNLEVILTCVNRFCMNMENFIWGPKKRASRISRWSNVYVLNMNTNILVPKISNIIEKLPKIAKNMFSNFPKSIQNQIKSIWIYVKSFFLYSFLFLMFNNP